MHQIILIEKDSPEYHKWPGLIRKNQMKDFSVDQVVKKYQGFEGELICISTVPKDEKVIKTIIEEYASLMGSENSLLLHTISDNETMPIFLQKEALFLGYDVGVCDEERSIYSSIFYEVLFGIIEELVSYKSLLNTHFLLPEKTIAECYVELHNRLSSEGKDVEDYEEMVIYEIWKDHP